ncbi:hypothetical protein K3N28_16875 [Glycomyces sp. TRM65418]|uniref:hypothetical protein n=1 Tax=Glycomyces sp. TRM65418 TaxID=2867006 RepID=UPI001CE6FB8C|nr:hypothetical protein [Glycomyces sp. TRM65418]MCC3764733.1 hypothetical protein [Glycomyces sp. TRM65418]QZD54390.1 hypothetical protein K3N28_16790 [Glycomyces sp. TRM65418]
MVDLFSRTMLACSAEAGLTTTALSRHVPLLRRNIGSGDQVSLLSRCVGSDGLGSGDHILMLTGERMVVTRQSRLLGRVRLCLDAPVAAIENLRWSADPAGPGVELNFTVLEGPDATEPRRWHFWLPASHAKRVWRIDALLARAFRRPRADSWAAGESGRSAASSVIADPVPTEHTVKLVRPALADVMLAEAALPVGTAHPASPLPAPDPRLRATVSSADGTDRSAPSPSPFPSADQKVAAPGADSAINANRPGRVPVQPTGFQPTGFGTTLAPA